MELLERTYYYKGCMAAAAAVFLLLLSTSSCEAQLTADADELLNWCIDGVHHKERPSQEDQLHQMCIPWKSRSCCTHNVSRNVHTGGLYGFDWNHCGAVKEMSERCRRHFVQDLCFYECEPNVGPWVVKVDMKIRQERFVNVPLCATDCDDWFRDCRDEYTCVDNWTTKFLFSEGKNHCPKTATCRPYSEVFKDAAHFCETIWDHSWKYTPNNEPCMRLWFDGSAGNPNDAVAKWRVEELMAQWAANGACHSFPVRGTVTTVLLPTLLISCLAWRLFSTTA